MKVHPLAGKTAPHEVLVNVPELISRYYLDKPESGISAQAVSFGTSGHRGSSLNISFNEYHVLAISQAIAQYRKGAAYGNL